MEYWLLSGVLLLAVLFAVAPQIPVLGRMLRVPGAVSISDGDFATGNAPISMQRPTEDSEDTQLATATDLDDPDVNLSGEVGAVRASDAVAGHLERTTQELDQILHELLSGDIVPEKGLAGIRKQGLERALDEAIYWFGSIKQDLPDGWTFAAVEDQERSLNEIAQHLASLGARGVSPDDPEYIELRDRLIGYCIRLRQRFAQVTPRVESAGPVIGERGEGRTHDTRARYETALAIYRDMVDRGGEASVLAGLADLDRAHGRDAHARASYQAALEIYRELGDHIGQASVLAGLADLDRAHGRLEHARAGYQAALEIYRGTSDRDHEVREPDGDAHER